MNIIKFLKKQAKLKYKTIVFPEAGFSDRIIKATQLINAKKIAKVILIADESALSIRFKNIENLTIINPKTSELAAIFAQKLFLLREGKITAEKASELVIDPFYFSAMLVYEGYADGMVSGAEVATIKTLKPALEIIKASDKLASSSMLFLGKHKHIKMPIMIADPGLNPNPTEEQLSFIAKQAVDSMQNFFQNKFTPKVAFLSYSTKGSASGEMVDKMKNAYLHFAKNYPDIIADGELQLDTALNADVANKKSPDSPLKGDANILILPDLNCGNIVYKTIQYFGNLKAIGPIVQGLNKPVNDLSRGCTVKDIIILTILTVLQCK